VQRDRQLGGADSPGNGTAAELPALGALASNRSPLAREIAALDEQAPAVMAPAPSTQPLARRATRVSLRSSVALALSSSAALVMGLLGPDLVTALRTAAVRPVSRRRFLMPWRSGHKPTSA
jgi:hypothetical protein